MKSVGATHRSCFERGLLDLPWWPFSHPTDNYYITFPFSKTPTQWITSSGESVQDLSYTAGLIRQVFFLGLGNNMPGMGSPLSNTVFFTIHTIFHDIWIWCNISRYFHDIFQALNWSKNMRNFLQNLSWERLYWDFCDKNAVCFCNISR